jgi:hypothetical protein
MQSFYGLLSFVSLFPAKWKVSLQLFPRKRMWKWGKGRPWVKQTAWRLMTFMVVWINLFITTENITYCVTLWDINTHCTGYILASTCCCELHSTLYHQPVKWLQWNCRKLTCILFTTTYRNCAVIWDRGYSDISRVMVSRLTMKLHYVYRS